MTEGLDDEDLEFVRHGVQPNLKLATAAGTAVQSALFALHGLTVGERDGIVAFTPEQTMKNMGQISTEGMIETDRTILQIMIDKQFS